MEGDACHEDMSVLWPDETYDYLVKTQSLSIYYTFINDLYKALIICFCTIHY